MLPVAMVTVVMKGAIVLWRTIAMNEKLCLHFGEHGAFPTPADLAAVTPTRLFASMRCSRGVTQMAHFWQVEEGLWSRIPSGKNHQAGALHARWRPGAAFQS